MVWHKSNLKETNSIVLITKNKTVSTTLWQRYGIQNETANYKFVGINIEDS